MFFYRLLTIILSPIIIGHIIWLSVKNRQSHYFWQRLGFKYSNLPTECLWFHCASVGEVNTLLPLIKNIHDANNKLKIIITTNTITGAKIANQQNLDYLTHSYLPFDWVSGVNRFLNKTRPISAYIMETEIWPNLFGTCRKKSIPVYIINARLSNKTITANTWVRKLLKISLSNVTAIYSRSTKDTESYVLLGASEEKVSTVGNLKLTTALSHQQSSTIATIPEDREYVLVASTHKDEERQIYNTWKKLHRNELLVIAPRHPERAASIISQLDSGAIAIRSKNQSVSKHTEIFLLDTVGELQHYFNKAKVVIMGGSFVPVGGHNILEPASYNCAIITGPYMDNFKEELNLLLDKKAIIHINSKLQAYPQLQEQLIKLLVDENYRATFQHNTAKLSHDVKKILGNYTRLIINKKLP